MADANLKKKLKTYLENVKTGIEKGHKVGGVIRKIQTESDLEEFVHVKAEGTKTLLCILGYNDNNVEDKLFKVVLVGTKKYVPDYVLHREKTQKMPLAVLDLKKPAANLDFEDWHWQVFTYCQHTGAPIGLLFNGHSLRVFINTDIEQLSQYKGLFVAKPVAKAEYDNLPDMIELLIKFSFASLKDKADSIALAGVLAEEAIKLAEEAIERDEKIAREKIAEAKRIARQKEIRGILMNWLKSPSPPAGIKEVLAALTTVDILWAELKRKPTEKELIEAWNLGEEPAPPDLTHSKLLNAKFDGVPIKNQNWKKLLEQAHITAHKKLGSFEALHQASGANNIRQGEYEEGGFSYLPSIDISLPAWSANMCWENSLRLAQAIGVSIEITVKWPLKPKVSYPGETRTISWTPLVI